MASPLRAATSGELGIHLWPNPAPLECGVIAPHERQVAGNASNGKFTLHVSWSTTVGRDPHIMGGEHIYRRLDALCFIAMKRFIGSHQLCFSSSMLGKRGRYLT